MEKYQNSIAIFTCCLTEEVDEAKVHVHFSFIVKEERRTTRTLSRNSRVGGCPDIFSNAVRAARGTRGKRREVERRAETPRSCL